MRERGWRLAILSNTDRDLIEASIERIGVPVELAIVASEIGSYKPAHGHWDAFAERAASDRSGHVHVAASLYHDIAPAGELAIPAIWINRLGEESDLPRVAEFPIYAGWPTPWTERNSDSKPVGVEVPSVTRAVGSGRRPSYAHSALRACKAVRRSPSSSPRNGSVWSRAVSRSMSAT